MLNLLLSSFAILAAAQGGEPVADVVPAAMAASSDGSGPMGLGAIKTANKVKSLIGPTKFEDANPEEVSKNRVIDTISSIREYQADPSNDFGMWGQLMAGFSPDTSLTFPITDTAEVFIINIRRERPIFRAAFTLAEGSSPTHFIVQMFDPDGDLVYQAKNRQEGLVAIEATEFGEYILQIISADKSEKWVNLMSSSSSVKDLGDLYDLKGAQDGAMKLVRSASDLKRSMRFFQRRRNTHQAKIERNLKGINVCSVCLVLAAVLVAGLQVQAIKHLVRKRLRTMIY